MAKNKIRGLVANCPLEGGISMMVEEQKKENVSNLIELGKTKGNLTYDEIANALQKIDQIGRASCRERV